MTVHLPVRKEVQSLLQMRGALLTCHYVDGDSMIPP